MSKLLKFRDQLSIEEAAVYLSGLIGEPVANEDILDLFHWEWLPGQLEAHGRIVRLEPLYDPETFRRMAAAGHYEFKAGETVGMCFSLQFPCALVQLEDEAGKREVYTMRDEEGRFYAVLEEERGDYHPILSEDPDGLFDPDLMSFNPADIFQIAQAANAPGVSKRPVLRREVECLSAVKLFNLMPDEGLIRPQTKARMEPTPAAPSRNLIIAALLDLLSDRRLNQSGVIQEILERHPNKRGLGKRTLESVFAAARKAWSEETEE